MTKACEPLMRMSPTEEMPGAVANAAIVSLSCFTSCKILGLQAMGSTFAASSKQGK